MYLRSNASANALSYLLAAVLLILAAFGLARQLSPSAGASAAGGTEKLASSSYGQLPLSFQPNAGRYGSGVDYLASSSAGSVTLGKSGATLTPAGNKHSKTPIAMSLAGAELTHPVAMAKLPGVINDLRGDDPANWQTDISTFGRVRYESAYPGIDLDFHGTSGTLEYDFRLAPGADPNQIGINFATSRAIRIAGNGDLIIGSGANAIRQAAPVAFQPSSSGRIPVSSSFELNSNRVTFTLGSYDHSRHLVIDPLVLDYSTYLGGSGADVGKGIAVNASGSAYVTGYTTSTDFNTVSPIEGDDIDSDVFVSKLNPAGNALTYSTYLGGNSDDYANAIAVNASGSAYVTGYTYSTDFNTVGPIEGDGTGVDAFISKLNPAGNALTYSTYLGGGATDVANSIAVDSSGSAYVAGYTESTDFNTVGPIEANEANNDGFVSKLNPAGNALTYSTYLGGSSGDIPTAIAVNSSGSAYVTGYTDSTDFNTVGPIEGDGTSTDAFISKLNPAGNALTYSTYLGGNSTDTPAAIAVNASGSAYITGDTYSTDFNTVGPIEGDGTGQDIFTSKLNPAGNALTYSTYLGGNATDLAAGIAVDASGSAYITGYTNSTDFNTVGPIEGDETGTDAYVSKLNPAGSALAFSTYLGGTLADYATAIAVDSSGSAYVTGYTTSTDFNTVGQVEGDGTDADAFISKLDGTGPNTTIAAGPAQGSVTNDATPTFTFSSSESGSTFQCRVNRGAFSPCGSPRTLEQLGDGANELQVRALDDAANPDPTPAVRAFTVDTVAPETTLTKKPKKKLKTKKKKAKAKFKFSTEPGATLSCKLDKSEFEPCTSPEAFKLKKGKHTFKVAATDVAGNIDESPAKAKVKVVKKKSKKKR